KRSFGYRPSQVPVKLGNSFRIFKEGEQTVAAHVEKIMGNVGVGRRTVPVRVARADRARRRSKPVHDWHAQHTYIEIERYSHVIGDQREVMDSSQDRLTWRNRDLARQGSRGSHRDVHTVPPSHSQPSWGTTSA